MKTVRRFDVGGALLRSYRRSIDGALLAEGISSRECVLEYRRADGGIRRELVTLEALRGDAETLPRAAVTLEHPSEGFVNPSNVGKFQVGDVDGTVSLGGVKRADNGQVESDFEQAQGGFVQVRLAVRRQDALDAIDAGTHELSVGYEVDIDETPGEHPVFGRYDARQIGRRANHVAIVPRGRAGPTAALRVDHDDRYAVLPPAPAGNVANRAGAPRQDSERGTMNRIAALLACLGLDPRVDSDDAALDRAIDAAKTLKQRADAADEKAQAAEAAEKAKTDADGQIEQLKKDNEKLKGENDALKAKVEQSEKAEKDRKDAAELERLKGIAGKVGVKADGLDLPGLRIAVCKTRVDSVDDKTSAERLDGILDIIEADVKRTSERSRWDWAKGPDGEGQRADGAEPETRRDDFYNPYLSAADEARGVGGAQ